MDSPTFSLGNTLARYPYGDDFDGLRSLYGTATQSYFVKEMATTASTWGPEESGIGFANDLHVNAAVGKDGSGTTAVKILVGSLDTSGAIAVDNRAYPVSSVGTWNGFLLSGANAAIRPPSVAMRYVVKTAGVSQEVLAYALKQQNNSACPGIKIHYSNNEFANSITVSLLTDCTIHDPALAYDGLHDRFFLLYVAHSSTPGQDNVLMYRSALATNLGTWSTAASLNIVTVDSPSFACDASGNCILVYLSANAPNPVFVDQKTTIDATGNITLLGTSSSLDTYFKTVSATYRRVSGVSQWFVVDTFTGGTANTANGVYLPASLQKLSIPLSWTGADWVDVGSTISHRASLAGSVAREARGEGQGPDRGRESGRKISYRRKMSGWKGRLNALSPCGRGPPPPSGPRRASPRTCRGGCQWPLSSRARLPLSAALWLPSPRRPSARAAGRCRARAGRQFG